MSLLARKCRFCSLHPTKARRSLLQPELSRARVLHLATRERAPQDTMKRTLRKFSSWASILDVASSCSRSNSSKQRYSRPSIAVNKQKLLKCSPTAGPLKEFIPLGVTVVYERTWTSLVFFLLLFYTRRCKLTVTGTASVYQSFNLSKNN